MAAINFDMAFLPTEALAIHHRQAKDFDIRQSGFDGFQAMGLNNCDNELHVELLFRAITPQAKQTPAMLESRTHRGCVSMQTAVALLLADSKFLLQNNPPILLIEPLRIPATETRAAKWKGLP